MKNQLEICLDNPENSFLVLPLRLTPEVIVSPDGNVHMDVPMTVSEFLMLKSLIDSIFKRNGWHV